MSDNMMAVRLTGGDVTRREVSHWHEIVDAYGGVVARIPVPVVFDDEMLVQTFDDATPLIVKTKL